jgi:hypothetical protein
METGGHFLTALRRLLFAAMEFRFGAFKAGK